jgi:hypothetical protein
MLLLYKLGRGSEICRYLKECRVPENIIGLLEALGQAGLKKYPSPTW